MAYAKVCMIPRCPEPSDVRLRDNNNTRRVDLCMAHALVTIKHYGDNVSIVATYNGYTAEQVIEGTRQLKEMHNG